MVAALILVPLFIAYAVVTFWLGVKHNGCERHSDFMIRLHHERLERERQSGWCEKHGVYEKGGMYVRGRSR